MKWLVLFLALFLTGCTYYSGTYIPKGGADVTLRCGKCKRVIYDGPWELDSRGLYWPINRPNYCKPDDPNCVDRRMR